MNVSTFLENRPSREGTLVGLAGIAFGTLTPKGKVKDSHVLLSPSRIYFRNDGAVTIRSYKTVQSVTVADGRALVIFSAWDANGLPTPVKVEHVPDLFTVVGAGVVTV